MSQITYNGAVVPTNSDAYTLTADLVKMCNSLNIPIPVDNEAQRNGLAALAGGTLKTGTMVLRKDQSMFIEKWDGASWRTSGHSEWTKDGHDVPANTVYGVGALALDSGKTTDSAFITHPASDVLQFRDAGNYALTFSGRANAALTTRGFLEFDVVGGSDPVRVSVTNEDRGVLTIPNWRATAGQQVIFRVYHESGGNRIMAFRIRATRIG